MTGKILNRATIFLLSICVSAFAGAQPGITVSAKVDKNKILIGEQINLTLRADIPENEAIRFFEIDTLFHFEFLEKKAIDTSNTSGGTILTQVIRITSFDSGRWVIPSFILSENLATDSIPIEVGFSPFDPNQAYHDIKDVIDVEAEDEKKKWLWYAIGGAVLLILLLYLLLRKKPKPVTQKTEQVADPFKEAMTQLEALQKQKPESKQYYSLLTDIFRLYIFRKKGILSLQKTTDDLVLQLRSLNINKDQFDKLAQALRLGDFVKFAKYQPAETDDVESLAVIKQAINAIEQSETTSLTNQAGQKEVKQ
jgi:hypothetical protein